MYFVQSSTDSLRPVAAQEAAGDDASLHTALGLTHHEVIWERRWDSKCVVAWGSSTVLVAFRGTASLSNVLSDIKVTWAGEQTGCRAGRRMHSSWGLVPGELWVSNAQPPGRD